MPYTIRNKSCLGCDNCRLQCPMGAIKIENNKYWIDPSLCNDCKGYYPKPQCATVCPNNSPIPLQAKKGRCKVEPREATSPDLFANGRTNFFASSIVIWEGCNILAQRSSLTWEIDDGGRFFYRRQINQGKGEIIFHIADSPHENITELEQLENIDLRAACLHLVLAAYATTLDQPWEQIFTIDDRQIEKYLGLEKRKDLSKFFKLNLIRKLFQQACSLLVSVKWFPQGRIKEFSFAGKPLWHLQEMKNYFQEDKEGCQYLTGITFKVKVGIWAKHFLNRQGCKDRRAFYQYGNLPKTLLTNVMSIWQQHEGTARLMLWLLFKVKMGKDQRIMVPTLMRIAYGEEKVAIASTHRHDRKRLLRTFEKDLEVLNHYGIKVVFDPVTYPTEIQPLWAKLIDIPEDPDEALEFWINDAGANNRLTDTGPRGKWNQLMNARILSFELPPEWEYQITKSDRKPRENKYKKNNKSTSGLLGEKICQARKKLSLSQRELAQLAGKSQSWIRDIENGRLKAKVRDQALLRKVLNIA
ncbi:Ferredoxin [Richelia intracellularis HH01]|uniref:Ferredoxin n=1 Tax=Richelia intracellularis HH01 TaxID=1165094 RepID=M1X5U0_9NOST|nr:helix-turn-helix domain-containing protein [Richelia intracellularis]CCH67611.1 Ferredoxin [Richelia intracellularis HH01]